MSYLHKQRVVLRFDLEGKCSAEPVELAQLLVKHRRSEGFAYTRTCDGVISLSILLDMDTTHGGVAGSDSPLCSSQKQQQEQEQQQQQQKHQQKLASVATMADQLFSKPTRHRDPSTSCLVQYVLFPPTVHNRRIFAVEVWVEPQHGVCRACKQNPTHLHGADFKGVLNRILTKDETILHAIASFDHVGHRLMACVQEQEMSQPHSGAAAFGIHPSTAARAARKSAGTADHVVGADSFEHVGMPHRAAGVGARAKPAPRAPQASSAAGPDDHELQIATVAAPPVARTRYLLDKHVGGVVRSTQVPFSAVQMLRCARRRDYTFDSFLAEDFASMLESRASATTNKRTATTATAATAATAAAAATTTTTTTTKTATTTTTTTTTAASSTATATRSGAWVGEEDEFGALGWSSPHECFLTNLLSLCMGKELCDAAPVEIQLQDSELEYLHDTLLPESPASPLPTLALNDFVPANEDATMRLWLRHHADLPEDLREEQRVRLIKKVLDEDVEERIRSLQKAIKRSKKQQQKLAQGELPYHSIASKSTIWSASSLGQEAIEDFTMEEYRLCDRYGQLISTLRALEVERAKELQIVEQMQQGGKRAAAADGNLGDSKAAATEQRAQRGGGQVSAPGDDTNGNDDDADVGAGGSDRTSRNDGSAGFGTLGGAATAHESAGEAGVGCKAGVADGETEAQAAMRKSERRAPYRCFCFTQEQDMVLLVFRAHHQKRKFPLPHNAAATKDDDLFAKFTVHLFSVSRERLLAGSRPKCLPPQSIPRKLALHSDLSINPMDALGATPAAFLQDQFSRALCHAVMLAMQRGVRICERTLQRVLTPMPRVHSAISLTDLVHTMEETKTATIDGV